VLSTRRAERRSKKRGKYPRSVCEDVSSRIKEKNAGNFENAAENSENPKISSPPKEKSSGEDCESRPRNEKETFSACFSRILLCGKGEGLILLCHGLIAQTLRSFHSEIPFVHLLTLEAPTLLKKRNQSLECTRGGKNNKERQT
jgi:hypothetical protein